MVRVLKKSLVLLPFLLIIAASGRAGDVKGAKPAMHEEQPYSDWRNKPHEPFSKGSEVFDLVRKELLKNYYDKGLTEDDLYRAAVAGMLSQIDPSMSTWNTLLSPGEYRELTEDLEGKVVGVGLQVNLNEVTGYAEVAGIVPGTPAAKSGIAQGDQILKIDGQSYRGKQLRDVVYAIRGKEGTEIKVTMLHDEQIKEFKLKRATLKLQTVQSRMLNDGIGYLSITSFIQATPAELKKQLADLGKNSLKGLIIDLRANEGGLFESSVDTMKPFFAKGKILVKMVKRGAESETIASTEDPLLKNVPLAVLISGSTKSSAEIMAGALKMSAGATTVGTRTYGKWSAQRIDELPNKFAAKYTIATFLPPNGKDLTGKGLEPDIVVQPNEQLYMKSTIDEPVDKLLGMDPQLEAADHILKLKR